MQTDNIGGTFALTPEQASFSAKVSRATWAGLLISLFAMGCDPPGVRVLRSRDHFCLGDPQRSADLAERTRSHCDHPARRTFAHALHWTRHRAGGNPSCGESSSRSYQHWRSARWLMSLATD